MQKLCRTRDEEGYKPQSRILAMLLTLEAKPEGTAHRVNAGQPLTRSASSRDAETKLLEGRGALTN